MPTLRHIADKAWTRPRSALLSAVEDETHHQWLYFSVCELGDMMGFCDEEAAPRDVLWQVQIAEDVVLLVP